MANMMLNAFTKLHVGLFHLSGGRIGSSMMGEKILLLTTIGNKSGQPRTSPVMQFDDGDRRYVIASAGGSPDHPAWFKNLQKTPEVTVEVRGEKYQARAEVVTGEERTRIWNAVVARMKQFDEYRKKAPNREIPVVELKKI